MIRRLIQRFRGWARAWLAGDDSTWLTDEYAAILDDREDA